VRHDGSAAGRKPGFRWGPRRQDRAGADTPRRRPWTNAYPWRRRSSTLTESRVKPAIRKPGNGPPMCPLPGTCPPCGQRITGASRAAGVRRHPQKAPNSHRYPITSTDVASGQHLPMSLRCHRGPLRHARLGPD
jgi:hypothetical protein